MIERLLEFALNHYVLVSSFFILWAVFFAMESRNGGLSASPQEATHLVNREGGLIVDVRSADEYREGHIHGSINIPFATIEQNLARLEKQRDKPLILVCKMGSHAGAVGKQLRRHGFSQLHRIRGGVQGWKAEGLPVVRG